MEGVSNCEVAQDSAEVAGENYLQERYELLQKDVKSAEGASTYGIKKGFGLMGLGILTGAAELLGSAYAGGLSDPEAVGSYPFVFFGAGTLALLSGVIMSGIGEIRSREFKKVDEALAAEGGE